jgi:hypothetical protein
MGLSPIDLAWKSMERRLKPFGATKPPIKWLLPSEPTLKRASSGSKRYQTFIKTGLFKPKQKHRLKAREKFSRD